MSDQRLARPEHLIERILLPEGRERRAIGEPRIHHELPGRRDEDDRDPVLLAREDPASVLVESREVAALQASRGGQGPQRRDRREQLAIDGVQQGSSRLDAPALYRRALLAVQRDDGDDREGDHGHEDAQGEDQQVATNLHGARQAVMRFPTGRPEPAHAPDGDRAREALEGEGADVLGVHQRLHIRRHPRPRSGSARAEPRRTGARPGW